MDGETWIGGDGGPLVVLQAGALPCWRGALDFMQSRMNGGELETDYDVICDCHDHHLVRHGREMLVLDDCSWSARLCRRDDGAVLIEQPYYDAEELPELTARLAGATPKSSFPVQIEDPRLRLLVGADTADGAGYGYSELEVTPGPWRCEVYQLDSALVLLLRPM